MPRIPRDADVADVARGLGLSVRERRGLASRAEIGPCPVCGASRRNGGRGEQRLAIGVTANGRGWQCHARTAKGHWCDARGDALDLVAWVEARARYRDLDGERRRAVDERMRALRGEVPTGPRDERESPRGGPTYPPETEVSAVWGDALVADLDPTVADALSRRCLDAGVVRQRGIARVLALDAAMPTWAQVGRMAWPQSGHRLVFELVDSRARTRSILARRLTPAKPKSAAARGYSRQRLALANDAARRLVRGETDDGSAPIVIAEGEIDYATWATVYDGPVLGIVAGSWTEEWAERVLRSGRDIVVATDHDRAGAKYAQQIIASLGPAVAQGRVSRWPAREDRVAGLADPNEYVCAGHPLHARGDPCGGAAPPADGVVDEPRGRTPDEDWRRLLTLTRTGTTAPTPHNLLVLLAHDPRWTGVLAYDERRETAVLVGPPPWTAECSTGAGGLPRPVTDEDAVRLGASVEREYGVTFRHDTIHRAIETIAQGDRRDEVREWMDGLVWDGVSRLDRWLTTYLGVPPTALSAACGARWMIGVVARTYQPGCKVDHVLVLVGPQGAGKSRALRALVGDAWFADQIAALASKDAAIGLHGPLVIELSELEALRRADLSLVKAFLTRQVDTYRPPYGRRNVEVRRRVSFAASTNEAAFLRDPTGGRRFWPAEVAVLHAIDHAALARDRAQLFGESVRRYRMGEPWWLHEPALVAMAAAAVETRREVDPWEAPIANHIAAASPPGLTVAGVLEGVLGLPVARHDQVSANRVVAILRDRMRWRHVQRRVQGRPTRMYVPPDSVAGVTGSRSPKQSAETELGGAPHPHEDGDRHGS